MAYQAPSITAAGLTIPQFTDILAYYVANAKSIFGNSIYLGNDSADYQMLAITALLASDCMSAAQLAYNSFGAQTATAAGQDALYKITGIARKAPSYSICYNVTLTGLPGAVILTGKVQDGAGNFWDLPNNMTLNGAGTLTVTATCETLGSVNAAPGTLTSIATPTYGWTSVTNSTAALPGFPVETDSQFRTRQAISVALSGMSPLNSVEAAIAQIAGVARYLVYENPTGAAGTDPNGFSLPAHSITAVVEGGNTTAIATALWSKKTPGALSNGTTTVNVVDMYNNNNPISFYILGYTPIYVALGIHQLTGYSAASTAQIQAAIATYLNTLAIGEVVLISALQAVAMSINTSLTTPTFAVRTCVAGTSIITESSSDVVLAFNYASQGLAANVTISFV